MVAVFVMRHGHAEAPTAGDAARPLSVRGMQAITQAGEALARSGVRFDCIVSSPLLRTRQTAETLAHTMELGVAVELCDAMRPGGRPEDMVEQALESPGEQTLMVGHMPDVSYLVGYLLTRTPVPAVTFAPGTIARIDFPGPVRPGTGTIRWVLEAEQLARLG